MRGSSPSATPNGRVHPNHEREVAIPTPREVLFFVRIWRVAELEVVAADVTKLEVDAIANAANTMLRHGGGVAGAISRAGGPEVQRESDAKAPIGLGEAVETTAGDMPARWVIHAATMHLGGPTSEDIIRRATASTLELADRLGAKSLALVAFGTGVGGFPVEDAARIEAEEVRRHLEGGSSLERVVFAVRGGAAKAAFDAGVAAPPSATARLRDLLADALRYGEGELADKRSGTRERPVLVALAADGERLLAAVPVPASLHADAEAVGERAWLLVAAVVGALVDLTEPGPPAGAHALAVRAGEAPAHGHALLGFPAAGLE